jgi:uncharacterized phage-associated protein
MKTVSTQAFAEYLVKKFAIFGDNLSITRLHTLLYQAQAWHLAYFDEPLLDENPCAGKFEPFFASLGMDMDTFPANIPLLAKNLKISEFDNLREQFYSDIEKIFSKFELTQEQQDFIHAFIQNFGRKNMFELGLLTHNDGIFEKFQKNPYQEIPLNDLKQAYQEALKKQKTGIQTSTPKS